jgi:hypothetical protein
MLVLSVNGVLCYFPPLVVLQGNVRMFGQDVDKTKVEVRVRVQNFLNKAFQKFHITIWSSMKLKDVLVVLPMFMLESFLDRFVFVWGCEKCSKTFGEVSTSTHYHLKDLKCMYYACHGKDYGKEDQTLLIDDEPNKVFWNLKWTSLFLESFRG